MPSSSQKSASPLLVIIAFATVYVVWGSTYFFIRIAEQGGLPPFMLGAIRFIIAGALMMGWCVALGWSKHTAKKCLGISVVPKKLWIPTVSSTLTKRPLLSGNIHSGIFVITFRRFARVYKKPRRWLLGEYSFGHIRDHF